MTRRKYLKRRKGWKDTRIVLVSFKKELQKNVLDCLTLLAALDLKLVPYSAVFYIVTFRVEVVISKKQNQRR